MNESVVPEETQPDPSILVGPSHEWWHHKAVRADLPPDLNVVPKIKDLLPRRDELGVVPGTDHDPDIEPDRYRRKHRPSNSI